MEPTTLEILADSNKISFFPTSMLVTCSPKWVVSGENRISYTTIIRLVECCREYHWKKDILVFSEQQNLDSITASIQGEFIHPIPVGCDILIGYRITDFSKRKYKLCVELSDSSGEKVFARIFLILVFYDPDKGQSISPPFEVARQLRLMSPTGI